MNETTAITAANPARPSWSRTRMSAFKDCRRRFALLNIQQLDPLPSTIDVSEVLRLKNLKNRHMWTGSTIHETVGTILKTVRQGNPPPEPAAILDQAKSAMRDQFRSSKSASNDFQLFEHEYNIAVAADTWQNHWVSVEKAIGWFLNSDWLKRLAQLGPETWKAIDEVLSFDVEDVRAYVKIDCAIELDGRFVLIDWKTSSSKNVDPFPLQLAALYAHDMWGADPSMIDARAVSVLNGEQVKVAIDEQVLMDAHLRVQEEASLLQEGLAGVSGDVLHIAGPSQKSLCRSCNFQRLCFSDSAHIEL